MRINTILLDNTTDEGNIEKSHNVFIYCNTSKDKFMEADSTRKLIKEFSVDRDLYRVYKYDWKGF